jgi:uncharacterized protein (TIGR02217 family)
MPYHLATSGDAQTRASIKRFDPRFWSINFSRPMMAAATNPGPHALRVDGVFYRADDLAGLIWEAEDTADHPLLAYETARDFRGCKLSFHWQSSGIMPLDAVNGPTLTIEGRDESGAPRSYYVRLWNYAVGTAENATITLDFGALLGGFLLPTENIPVFAGDVDRMFISLVPPGFTKTNAALPAPVEAWVELTGMTCDGPGSVLSIGDVLVPPHSLSLATGYDDSYNPTPARLIRTALHLGYRGSINHYVGMSHYFRLTPQSGSYYVSSAGGALNAPCAAWHADFAVRAKAADYSLIMSLSYELFDAHCWNDWKQRAWNGDPAHTGYAPPSVLLSPVHLGARGYLQGVARAIVQIAVAAGHAPRFQVGEPWWWVLPDGRPCLYDDASKAALGGFPVNIPTVRSTSLSAAQKALLDAAGTLLAASTASLVSAVKLDHPSCETLLLIYLPTILDAAAPDLKRANVPLGWAVPAFDVLQLEDYDWVTAGNVGASARGVAEATTRLGYGVGDQHYLAGFVLNAADKAQWRLIDAAADVARKRGVAETFIWASPQVVRDGYTHFDLEESDVDAFDDVQFPLAIGRKASVQPGFSTAVVTTASGHEQRNADWASGRMRYDAGPGVRSEADMQSLIAFFRARRGAAKGFRFRDPLDFSSNGMGGVPTMLDQGIGVGDGAATSFQLVKRYGIGPDAEVRRITRPEAGSVVLAVAGMAVTTGWTLGAKGVLSFTLPPASGAQVTAGFRFDVPVRFAEDTLSIDAVNFAAGDAGSVALVEVRED